MKKIIYLMAFVGSMLLLQEKSFAQGVAISNDNATAHSSAMLDVQSTEKGVLLPRVTQAQRTAIASPATSLLVYQTDGVAGFYFYNGAVWTYLNPVPSGGSSDASTLTGTLADARLSTNVTTQGNTFNGNTQLVQTTAVGALPTISGANLTNLNASSLSSGTVGTGRLGIGIANNATYLRGDGQWATVNDASTLTIGTLPAARMPALTGDVTTTAGSVATTIANDAVNSAKILNATILDADVSATAAIAGTKIAPNFGTQNVATTGSLDIATAKFTVDNTGNITKINNIATSFPAAQGAANTILKNDGAGNLTWGTSPLAAGSVTTTEILDATIAAVDMGVGSVDVTSTVVTGTLPITKGGTGISTAPTNSQLLIGNGTTYTQATLTGTTNQVTVTNSAGGITLSTPQNIAVASTPAFAGMTLSGLGLGVAKSSAGGVLSSALIVDADVSAIAAIAGTKIAPNFGTQNVATTGSLDIATTKFTVDNTGNITKINNVATSFPAAQGLASTVLTNNGAGVLTWAAPTATAWGLTGNTGTTAGTNFIGTTDAQPLIMRTNSTEKMRITSAGNVGIGTTTPNAPLQFSNAIVNRKIVLWDGNNNDHQFYGLGISLATLRYHVDGAGANHVFYAGATNTTSTELMRIQGNGNVGIGTSVPTAPLSFANTLANRKITLIDGNNNDHQFYGLGIENSTLRYQVDGAGARHVFYAGASTTTSTELMRIQGNGNVGIGTNAPTATLHVVGTTLAAAWTVVSDRRWKDNIQTQQNALANVMKLRGVTYTWNKEEIKGRKDIGFIAQEVEEVFPEIVQTNADGYKSMEYSRLTSVLVEAIKELKAENDKLKAELSGVKTENKDLKASLESRLQALEMLVQDAKSKKD